MFFERLDDLFSERKSEGKAGVDTPISLGQHRAMLGESENQFSLTRAALSTRGTQKQIPISIASPGVDQYRLAVTLVHDDKNEMG